MAEVTKYMVIVLEDDEVDDFESIVRHGYNRISVVIDDSSIKDRYYDLIDKLLGWSEGTRDA